MRREKIVPVRFTDSEYEKLIDLVQSADENLNVSSYIRLKLFEEGKEKNDYRETLFLIRQIRADISHAIKLYQKDFLVDAKIEMEACNKLLEDLQKEMKRDGGNSAGTHERI